jgi:uncharacterized protein YrrD
MGYLMVTWSRQELEEGAQAMVKATDVIGRRVMAREGGQEIGKVADIFVDPAGKQVLGFLISTGGLGGKKAAPWAALQAIGPDSVVLDSVGSVVKPDKVPEIKEILDKELAVRGLQLHTTQGKTLGKIEDFRFDEQSGAIEGFELSGGVFGHKSILPAPPSIELGKDVAFVAPEVEETIEKL